MTAMRESQVRTAKARVLLGGKVGPTLTTTPEGRRDTRWYSGRIPGVIEEALVSLKGGQPLYIIGAFGGAARLLVDILAGRHREEFTWEFQNAAPYSVEMRTLYEQYGPPWEDYDTMTEFFASVGVSGLSARNGLMEAENLELFQSRDVERIVELLLRGLTTLSA
jgi:hypothetical protein